MRPVKPNLSPVAPRGRPIRPFLSRSAVWPDPPQFGPARPKPTPPAPGFGEPWAFPGRGRKSLANRPEPHPPQERPSRNERLGEPLDLREVARMLGCSPWTVRQTLIPQGLPHLRFAASGKLVFFAEQVIRWVERRQRSTPEKGGN